MTNKKGLFKECGTCGTDVWVKPWKLKRFSNFFCSRDHHHKFQKKNAFNFLCGVCGEKVFTQPTQMKYRNRNTCSRKCANERKTMLAEKRNKENPPSQGVLNRRIRYSKKMDEWRIAIFKRDNYTCQDCGARSGNGKAIKLNVDHIKSFARFPELRFELLNGRTLCVECHRKTPTWGRQKKSGKALGRTESSLNGLEKEMVGV